MTQFVHTHFPTSHPGVVRAEKVLAVFKDGRDGHDGTRSLALMLLAAVVAALAVAADQLVETWADGHLMLAWVALWAVCFAGLALFTGAARHSAAGLMAELRGWSAHLAQRRADRQMWAAALSDRRVMADLQMAISRSEMQAEAQEHAARNAR